MSNFIRGIPSALKKVFNEWSYAMEKSFEYNYMYEDKFTDSPKRK